MASRKPGGDNWGWANCGSQLQVQIYVNRRQAELSERVLCSLSDTLYSDVPPDARLNWVSPLERDRFREYRDLDFLSVLGQEDAADDLAKFWPKKGPCWDALAIVESGSGEPPGVILVEAKSRPDELDGGGCKAESARSLRTIGTALSDTKRWLGVPEDQNWIAKRYQSANRLAHLYFFRQIRGVRAWLVNLYFIADPHFANSPRTREEWTPTIDLVKSELGLTQANVCYCANVFLPARYRTES